MNQLDRHGLSLLAQDLNSRILIMHVVMISKACIVGAYQRKLEELAQLPELKLTVLVPPSWRDNRGQHILERVFTEGYELRETPIAFNGHFHLHFYPRLGRELKELHPDLIHIDEEPYNLATRHAMGLAQGMEIPSCFFTWQNLFRHYPPPFRWWERYVFQHASCAIAGNHDATRVLQKKGYRGPVHIIPQFGVDPHLFSPTSGLPVSQPFTLGYAGGLITAKGLDTLLHACRRLHGDWRLLLAGSGDQEQSLRDLAKQLDIESRINWRGKIISTDMPAFYRELDAFVLPSRSQPTWIEQFGRVLVEAMACGVPVIGSESGEIPHVIGKTGLTFPEDDADALTAQIQLLMNDPELCEELGRRGRARVLEHFTQAQIARQTYDVYREILDRSGA